MPGNGLLEPATQKQRQSSSWCKQGAAETLEFHNNSLSSDKETNEQWNDPL